MSLDAPPYRLATQEIIVCKIVRGSPITPAKIVKACKSPCEARKEGIAFLREHLPYKWTYDFKKAKDYEGDGLDFRVGMLEALYGQYDYQTLFGDTPPLPNRTG